MKRLVLLALVVMVVMAAGVSAGVLEEVWIGAVGKLEVIGNKVLVWESERVDADGTAKNGRYFGKVEKDTKMRTMDENGKEFPSFPYSLSWLSTLSGKKVSVIGLSSGAGEECRLKEIIILLKE